ncbi:uncharacterized protein LOC136767854 [Amia ocellicauda]|uniref:uncharacterized protein LOC136767854 n=1 Tax=Amia ocellicauda TaxID=2972642 RepID=UPI003464A408
MSVSAALSGRLSSALAELMRAALCEIWKAVEETVSESRVEITRRQRENEALRRRLQELMVAGEAAVCHWSSGADGPPVQSRGAGRREWSCGRTDTRGAASGAVEASALPDSGERAPIDCEQEWGSSLRQDTEPTDTEDNMGLTEQHRSRLSEEELRGLESGHMVDPEVLPQGLRALGSECGPSAAGVKPGSHRTHCGPSLVPDYIKTEDDTLESVYTMAARTQALFRDTLSNLRAENIIENIYNLGPDLSVGGQCDPESAALRMGLSVGSDSAVRGESSLSLFREQQPGPSSSHSPPSPLLPDKQQGRHYCSQCGKTYSNFENFKKHQGIHTAMRPYCCVQCGKSFVQAGDLRLHERIHTGERPYCCGQCGKSFVLAGNLKTHQRVHTGEKPYSCPQCGKRFGLAGNLKAHQRIHTGERPYCCPLCGKSFTELGNYKRHEKTHK